MIETLAELPAAGPTRLGRLEALALAILRPLLVVAVSLLIGFVIIMVTGGGSLGDRLSLALQAYENLLIEPFRGTDSLEQIGFEAIPLALTGLAAAIAFRANIFNIGEEGQLQIGALFAAAAALSFARLPPVLLVPVVVLAGALGGAAWASIAGWLRAYWGATELVSTIMLNYVAIDIGTYMISTGAPLSPANGNGTSTATITSAAWFPTIGNSQFHWGFVVPLAAAALVFVVLYLTPLGYEIRMVGANAPFAHYGGVAVRRVIITAMALSGALAGIGGAVQVMGFAHAYNTTFPLPQWGFTGVTVALLARLEPIGVIVAALLYALLEEGGQLMEDNTSVDHSIIGVIQGLLILFVTVQVTVRWWRRRGAVPLVARSDGMKST
jgi:simple sugar transport system permease protein